MAATHVHHMQKALDQMNLQVHRVISDITGQTGLAIVDAILAGKRDPGELAKPRHERIQASEEVIAKSLVGDYRPEQVFTLRQSLTAYRSYQKLIDDCDREIRGCLEEFKTPRQPDASVGDRPQKASKTPSPDGLLRSELKRVRHRSDQDSRYPCRHCPDAVRRDRSPLQEVSQRFRVRFMDGIVPG